MVGRSKNAPFILRVSVWYADRWTTEFPTVVFKINPTDGRWDGMSLPIDSGKEYKMTKFINLTPHSIRLRTEAADTAASPRDDDIVVAPDPNGPARVATTPGALLGELDGVALYGATQFGEVEGLPTPQADTVFIVSALVGGQVSGRTDVVQPGTGPADGTVRNEAGQIFAVTRLVQAC